MGVLPVYRHLPKGWQVMRRPEARADTCDRSDTGAIVWCRGREITMIAASVIRGVLLMGVWISRVKACRGTKKNVQTVSDTEK